MGRGIALLAAPLALTLLACGGGTRWAMVITSEPSQALVYVNDYPRGVTPVEVPYIYIGTYRVQLMSEGYEETNTLEEIGKPWYTWIPFMGLLLDCLPIPVHHEVRLHYDLVPTPPEEF